MRIPDLMRATATRFRATADRLEALASDAGDLFPDELPASVVAALDQQQADMGSFLSTLEQTVKAAKE